MILDNDPLRRRVWVRTEQTISLLDMSKDCNQCLYIIYSVFSGFPCDLSQTTVAMMNSIGSCPRFSLPRKTSSLCRLTWHGSGALVRRPNQMGQQGDWRSVQVGTHTCTGIAHTHAPTYIYMYIYKLYIYIFIYNMIFFFNVCMYMYIYMCVYQWYCTCLCAFKPVPIKRSKRMCTPKHARNT